MNQRSNISALLCLLAFAGCSNAEKMIPPEYLMEPARPLAKPAVPTTRQLVDRTLAAERSYEELAARFNTLVAWIRATTP